MEWFLKWDYVLQMLHGMVVTAELFLVSGVLTAIVSILLVFIRTTGFAPCRFFVTAYVEFHRNVPFLVLICLWYFGVPELLSEDLRREINRHNTGFIFAAIALGLGSAAYATEDIRSGLRSIPATQFEAVRALGATYLQAMRHVILPQALRAAIPPLIGRALQQFKNTSLAMAVGVMELSYVAFEIENETYKLIPTFGTSTALYLSGSFVILWVGGLLYKRYHPKS